MIDRRKLLIAVVCAAPWVIAVALIFGVPR